MKVAVLSDIHSNLHALRAVLEEIDDEHAELIVCAGDVVGYGAFPNECCAIVKERALATVAGNHDLCALSGDTSWMNSTAAQAIVWTSAKLTAESRAFLSSLRREAGLMLGDAKTAIHHGSPGNPYQYVYMQDASEDMLTGTDSDLLILGHTHVPYVVPFGRRKIVNPGSVGQPRDDDCRACYAQFNTKTRECAIRRVEYDTGAARDAILSARLPKVLGERLLRGW